VKWVVEGILPTGLALLGGPPKLAKSLTALDFALGVSYGGPAMSELVCHQGSVLYLSLDNDSERRLAYRAKYILAGDLKPDLPIEFHCEWPTGDAAIKACQEWVDDEVDEHREPLLVVVDTLGKVEPNFEGGAYENAYLASTATLSRWSKFATDNDVAVLAVHHDRKSSDDDWLNRFTGSRGITATAQTLMMLEAKRGEPTGWLRVTGRDIESDDLELRRTGMLWKTMDRPRVGLHAVQ
jgi:RecA-family ATPase